jgi:hypothetical protein
MPYGTLNVDKIVNDNGVTFAGLYGFKNRIINGAMMIDQRNAGASVTQGTSISYVTDRFGVVGSAASKFTAQQSSTAPTGFINSLLCTSSSAYTVGSSEDFTVRQVIEGLNCADFAWGSANAATVTLSFWVRSSLTGTFGGSVSNSAQDRFYVFSYTINAANTWEQKTITITGDTSGTWLTTNGIGIRLFWSLGAGATVSGTAGSWGTTFYRSATGATSVVGTNGATFYITGVQLEAGSTATSFDRRPYGTELALCQRYYFRISTGASNASLGTGGWALSTTGARVMTNFPVEMRTEPSALEQTGTASDYKVAYANTSATCSAVPQFANASKNIAATSFTVASVLTAGQGVGAERNANTAYLGWSAEL